jgi:predicted nucleic acid-binding protein
VASLPYRKPYIDSDVFIGVIKNETVEETLPDKSKVQVERGKIGSHVLTLAEQGFYTIYISPLTIAEVHKLRHKEKLTDDENENVLEFFENDFVTVVPIDRKDGEEANRLCRKYQAEKLSPNDALHMVCAIKAGCDVLFTWDKDFLTVVSPDIEIKRPFIWEPPRRPVQTVLFLPPPTTEPIIDGASKAPPVEAVAPQTELKAGSEEQAKGPTGE